MPMNPLAATALAVAISISIAGCAATNANSVLPGRIVFHSDRSGNSEIYRIDVDGNNQVRLTNNNAYDGFPSWSPDGSRVLFQSDRDGELAIYSMQADGSNPFRIPNTEFGNYAKWSADGKRIAFFSERNGVTDIYSVNDSGDDLKNLTQSQYTDETPSWTADGSTIAFQSDRSWRQSLVEKPDPEQHANFGVFTMAADNTVATEITGLEFNDENPSINPNGNSVIFQRYVDNGLAIACVNLRSGDTRLLTTPSETSGSPAWSSSGKQIVFDSMRDGNFDIYLMDATGENLRQVTFTDGHENSGAALYDGHVAH